MTAKIMETYQRMRHLLTTELEPKAIPDYTSLYAGLQELAAEAMSETGWAAMNLEGGWRGGTQAAWTAWLSEWGPTYKGVVRLQRMILALAYDIDQETPLEELSA